MAQTDLVQAFEARLKMYSLDGRARSILAETWPVIEPTLDDAIAEIITAVRVLPRIGEIVARNAELYKKLEAAHFRALLGGKLDGAYANRAGTLWRRRRRSGSTRACALRPAVTCSRRRSTRWRASTGFRRQKSPSAAASYRRPSASTSPMP